jgi:hypothetical protein
MSITKWVISTVLLCAISEDWSVHNGNNKKVENGQE